MRLLVMFDLPVKTKKERKHYARFRKFLINDGYDMLQFSVYCRITLNHDDLSRHLFRLNSNLPPRGSVRALSITEKQYASMMILLGTYTPGEDLLKPTDILEL